MTFGSVFAGIGGFDLGFERAGLRCRWQIENDTFCNRVLAKRWPGVTRYGDVREVDGRELKPVDVLCGGFPCQDLSVAGKRAGLSGERSGLFWHLVRLASEKRPAFLVFENVPGLLSSCSCRGCRVARRFLRFHRHRNCGTCKACVAAGAGIRRHAGSDLAVVCAAVAQLGYSLAIRVLDAQWFGVAQRRRRVFIVGHSDPARAAAVLFEPQGSAGAVTPVRKAGTDVAHSLDGCTGGVSGKENQRTIVPYNIVGGAQQTKQHAYATDKTGALQSKGNSASGNEAGTVIAHTLRAEGFDASEDGTGRGTPLVARPLTAHGGSHGRIDGESETFASPPPDPDRMRDAPGVSAWLDEHMPPRTDGPRYRALGNAVAVPVAEWIGRRLICATPAA